MVTQILMYLLENKKVDAIIHIGVEEGDPIIILLRLAQLMNKYLRTQDQDMHLHLHL